MTTKIDYVDLPEAVRAKYKLLDVKRASRHVAKSGAETYTVETYRGGKDKWRLVVAVSGVAWVKEGCDE